MSGLSYAALEIDADFPDVGQKTGRFEFVGGEEGSWSIEQGIRGNYVLDSAFDDVAALFTDLTGVLEDNGTDRKGINIDVGGGQHFIQLEFQTPSDTTNPTEGRVAQWGSSPDPGVGPNRHTATGASKAQQMQCLMEYLRVSGTGSLSPGRWMYQEYSPSGYLDDHLAVAIEEPSVRVDNVDPYWADGSMTLVETRDLNNGADEQQLEDAG